MRTYYQTSNFQQQANKFNTSRKFISQNQNINNLTSYPEKKVLLPKIQVNQVSKSMAIGKRDIIRIPQASHNTKNNNFNDEKKNYIDDDCSSSAKRKIKLSKPKKKQVKNQQGQGGGASSNGGGDIGIQPEEWDVTDDENAEFHDTSTFVKYQKNQTSTTKGGDQIFSPGSSPDQLVAKNTYNS